MFILIYCRPSIKRFIIGKTILQKNVEYVRRVWMVLKFLYKKDLYIPWRLKINILPHCILNLGQWRKLSALSVVHKFPSETDIGQPLRDSYMCVLI